MDCLELRISVRRCIAILWIMVVTTGSDHDEESQGTRHMLETAETRNFTDVYLAASEII